MRARPGQIDVRGLDFSSLQTALDVLTLHAADVYRAGRALSVLDPAARVRYRREPRAGIDREHFDAVGIVLERGHGDCDDLAPALAGELVAKGIAARAVPTPTERGTIHVVVSTPWGIIDPSRILFEREQEENGVE